MSTNLIIKSSTSSSSEEPASGSSKQLICLKNMNNLNEVFEFAKNDLNSKYLSENIKKNFSSKKKRIKLKEQQHQQRRLLFSSNIVQINDLDQMKCNFIDVQNYNENDLVPFSYDNKELNFDLELQKQNIQEAM